CRQRGCPRAGSRGASGHRKTPRHSCRKTLTCQHPPSISRDRSWMTKRVAPGEPAESDGGRDPAMYMVAIIKRGAIGNANENRLARGGRYGYHLGAMEPRSLPTDGAVAQPASNSRWWLVVFLGLLAWQGWMTLTLFGTDRPWQRILDDEPIISGAHP